VLGDMTNLLWELRLWSVRIVLAILLGYSLWQAVARPVDALRLTFPAPFTLKQFALWLASPEWVVFFAVGNLVIFIWSLHPINKATGTSFVSTILEDSLIGAQMGALLLTASLLIGATAIAPRAIAAPTLASASDWRLATLFGLLANFLAFVDSVAQRAKGSVGPAHFIVWLVQNLGCILFFGTIFVNTLRGAPGFAFLNSPRAALLWLPVLVLVGATYLDFKWPITK